MSEYDMPLAVECAGDRDLSRPGHGHQPKSDDDFSTAGQSDHPKSDPHPDWLKEWRYLRAQVSDDQSQGKAMQASRERLRWLQEKIAHTPVTTKAGLLAQAELICDLAWNDIVAAAARHLVAGIKRDLA